jgi:hypothetical protein
MPVGADDGLVLGLVKGPGGGSSPGAPPRLGSHLTPTRGSAHPDAPA